ncbi:MAG: CPBP family intramembrane metalloprotease [bacterium]|nr:CPBP family intramembrane metalloprotease [bacterium]
MRYIGRIAAVTALGAVVFGVALFVTVAAAAVFGETVFETAWISAVIQLTLLLITSLAFIVVFSRGEPARFGLSFVGLRSIRVFLWPVGLGVVLGLISSVLLSLLPDDFVHPASQFTPFQMILIIWIFAPISEEVFVRGLLQGFLARLSSEGATVSKLFFSIPVVYGAFLFGVMHLTMLANGAGLVYTLIICLFAFSVGLLAGYWRERTSSLVPAIIAHSFANVGGSLGAFVLNLIGNN